MLSSQFAHSAPVDVGLAFMKVLRGDWSRVSSGITPPRCRERNDRPVGIERLTVRCQDFTQ
jgi:hypothetical protein